MEIIKAIIILLVIDIFYLLFIAKPIYQKTVLSIQKTPMDINIFGALGSYLFLSLALYYFIIKENKKPFDAFILGLCIYGVFDMTNIAIFKNYDINTALIDTIWGGTLFYLTIYVYRKIYSQ